MSDLISREDAMAFPLSWDHRDKEHGSDEFISGVECYRDYIEGLPSAQPDVARDIATIIKNEQDMMVMLVSQQEQRWIPVSERLPEEGVPVLVSAYGNITDGVHERGWWLAWGDRGSYEDEENVVDAWMPLPKPYKGEEE